MKMNKTVGLMAVAGCFVLSGCTSVYVPKDSAYSTDKIPMYTCSSQVTLINGQPSHEEILFAENMGHDFLADLNEWTDVAIEIAERELNERGASRASKTGASLTLKVVKASTTTGGWGFRGHVTLEATMGSGLKREYEGSAPAGNLYNATSGALAHAVTRMLSDQDMIVYLTQ